MGFLANLLSAIVSLQCMGAAAIPGSHIALWAAGLLLLTTAEIGANESSIGPVAFAVLAL